MVQRPGRRRGRERARACSTGGDATGPCYQATLVTDVPAGLRSGALETFGPVATFEVVDNEDEAVARANATSYGLAAGHHHERHRTRASRCRAASTRASCTSTTRPVHDEPQMPFGGVKDSGWGRFGGTFAMDEFTEMRWVTVQTRARPFPF